jgi:hypothetical protein
VAYYYGSAGQGGYGDLGSEGWLDSRETAAGIIASNRLSYDAIKIGGVLTVRPELEATLSEMPDGTEFTALLGVGGYLGF